MSQLRKGVQFGQKMATTKFHFYCQKWMLSYRMICSWRLECKPEIFGWILISWDYFSDLCMKNPFSLKPWSVSARETATVSLTIMVKAHCVTGVEWASWWNIIRRKCRSEHVCKREAEEQHCGPLPPVSLLPWQRALECHVDAGLAASVK